MTVYIATMLSVRRLLHRAIAEWKREYVARQYGEGKMTLGKAAQEADLSLWEMMDYARQRKIAVQYDLEDFSKEVESITGRVGSARTKAAD